MVTLMGWAPGALFTGLFGLFAAGVPITPVPSSSPLSYERVGGSEKARDFVLNANVTAKPMQPFAVSVVAFHDERPYGEVAHQEAWLAEYRDVSVAAPDGKSTALVSIFAVVSPGTGLVTAFTAAAPAWPKSGWKSEHISTQAAERWEFFSAEPGTEWESTIVEVLQEVWKHYGVDPSRAGQITIRPRRFLSKSTTVDAHGKPMPREKVHGWLVEVLGTYFGVNPFGDACTVRLVVFRDGDLQFCGGLLL